VVVPIKDGEKYMHYEILKIKLKYMFHILVIGHHLLSIADHYLGEVNLNEKFNFLAGIPREKLVSQRIREACIAWPQEKIPPRPYAFVDHHPNTSREILDYYIFDVKNRGLEVILNDTSTPLYAFIDVLDEASEIHCVASAPLCLALTVNVKCNNKYYYRTEGQGTIRGVAYNDWTEIDLRSSKFTQINNPRITFRSKIEKFLLGGGSGLK
jgi:hypothetical protein